MISILSFILAFSFADSETYKISGKEILFVKSGVWVDRDHCEKKDCDAVRVIADLKPHSRAELARGEKHKSSDGSLVCAKVFKANSILGKRPDGDMRAFCVFKDESLMELNSLSDYLAEKKLLK